MEDPGVTCKGLDDLCAYGVGQPAYVYRPASFAAASIQLPKLWRTVVVFICTSGIRWAEG